MLAQKRSVAQTPRRGVCCLCKRELVGAQPLHLAIARPFCRLKAPLGLSLLHFVSQTRTCRSETPPSCYRKTVLSLKHPAGVFVASANANLSGRSPSILLSQDRSVAQTSHWDVCCLCKRELVGALLYISLWHIQRSPGTVKTVPYSLFYIAVQTYK